MLDKVVMEYSQSQQCFHVHTVEDMINASVRCIAAKGKTDYLPICIFKDWNEYELHHKKVQSAIESIVRRSN